MAKQESSEPQFKDVRTGIGEEWDFEKNGPLTGNYIGSVTVPVPKIGREQTVYQFAPQEQPDMVVFLWGSATLDAAFKSEDIALGSLMRITFLGIDQFKSDEGPRQIKRYRVQVAE